MPASDRCSQVRSLLPRLAAGEVTLAQSDACRIHLAACTACRSEADATVRAQRVLVAYRPAPPPPGLDRRICQAARATRTRRWAPLRWAQAGGLLAAAAAAAACVQLVPGLLAVRTEPGAPPPQPVASEQAGPRGAAPPSAVRAAAGAGLAPEAAVAKEPDGGSAEPTPPARIAGRRNRTRRPANPMPSSFMDVRDASGRSARQIVAAMRDQGAAAGAVDGTGQDATASWRTGRIAVPGRPVYETRTSEGSLQVGRRRVRTSAEAGWDAQGHLSVIRLGAEVEGDQRPDGPDRAPK